MHWNASSTNLHSPPRPLHASHSAAVGGHSKTNPSAINLLYSRAGSDALRKDDDDRRTGTLTELQFLGNSGGGALPSPSWTYAPIVSLSHGGDSSTLALRVSVQL